MIYYEAVSGFVLFGLLGLVFPLTLALSRIPKGHRRGEGMGRAKARVMR